MCDSKQGCQKPEKLVGNPEGCSAEQIKKCHGDEKDHPCVDTAEAEESDRAG